MIKVTNTGEHRTLRKPKTSPKDRRCGICGARLSVYNHGKECNKCADYETMPPTRTSHS